jgi:hypothetical protein
VTPNGGTITLVKNGEAATISLEYSLDGVNWTEWAEDVNTGNRNITLAAGERMYVRSTSLTTARFSATSSSYYNFVVPEGTAVNGILESLLCRTPELGEIGNSPNNVNQFINLFVNQKITGRPIINSKTLKQYSLSFTFKNTRTLTEVEIHSTNIQSNSLTEWLNAAASVGTIYAPASLSMANNSVSGVPAGWTRVDI